MPKFDEVPRPTPVFGGAAPPTCGDTATEPAGGEAFSDSTKPSKVLHIDALIVALKTAGSFVASWVIVPVSSSASASICFKESIGVGLLSGLLVSMAAGASRLSDFLAFSK